MFLLLLIGTNISNKWINFLVKSLKELTCMWNFEAKVVLGMLSQCVSTYPKVPEYSGVRRKFSWGWFGSRSYGGYLFLVCAVCDVTI